MIFRHQNRKYLLVTLISILLGITLMLSCIPASPSSTPAQMPAEKLTNSETDSRIAELEAKIRQLEAENRELEAENQSLLTENRQLNSDLQKIANQLDIIQSLTTSSKYTNTLSNLGTAQIDTSDLAGWVYDLPDLPELPSELNLSEIREAIDIANSLRQILKSLPPPPPLIAPPQWVQMDDMKETFISMTEWMEALEDLPGFLMKAEELEDVKPCIQNYLENVDTAMYDAKEILEQVRDASRP